MITENGNRSMQHILTSWTQRAYAKEEWKGWWKWNSAVNHYSREWPTKLANSSITTDSQFALRNFYGILLLIALGLGYSVQNQSSKFQKWFQRHKNTKVPGSLEMKPNMGIEPQQKNKKNYIKYNYIKNLDDDNNITRQCKA